MDGIDLAVATEPLEVGWQLAGIETPIVSSPMVLGFSDRGVEQQLCVITR